MKRHTVMDWSIRNNSGYLLALVILCGLIPHGMLSLLQIASASDRWSPAEIEAYSNFFVCQWTPFWICLIAYLRLQSRENFSLLPAIGASVIIVTFLPRYAQRSVATIALVIPLILIVELSALLKRTESSPIAILAGISADRGMLRAFFFWSVGFLCVTLISCEACTWDTTVASPFLMLPIPGVLLLDVFKRQKDKAPTLWGILAMLAMVPGSMFLATLGPMERFKFYHLLSLGLGYGFLLVMVLVYNMDQWKKQNDQV